jgi:acyl carrier protein
VLPLAVEPALLALQQALDQDETCLTLADIDWERFAPEFAGIRPNPLIHDLPEVRNLKDRAITAATEIDMEASSLAQRLAGLSPTERDRAMVDLVRGEAAVVLGHFDATKISGDQAFRELGFDSLTAVQLRNRLNSLTGLTLPTGLVFDYPTANALGKHLRAGLFSEEPSMQDFVLAEVGRLEESLSGVLVEQDVQELIATRLETVLLRWREKRRPVVQIADASSLESITDDEIFRIIDEDFGLS